MTLNGHYARCYITHMFFGANHKNLNEDTRQTVSPCELWRSSQRKLTAMWGSECGRKLNGQREGEVRIRLSLVRIQPFAC